MTKFRPYLFLFIGLLLGANVTLSHAAYTRASNPSFKASPTGGGPTWTGNGGVSGGSAATVETVNVGGKYVGVPHVGPLGAAAIEAVIIGVRAFPQTFVASLAIGYLAQKGLELIDGAWKTHGPDIPVDPGSTSGSNYFWSTESGVQNACAGSDPLGVVTCAAPLVTNWSLSSSSETTRAYIGMHPQWGEVGWTVQKTIVCSGTMILQGSQCVYPPEPCPADYTDMGDGTCRPTNYVPAGESDWDRVRGVTPPDAVMADLCKRLNALGTPCPVNGIYQTAVTEPLSDWVTDPTTGVQTRQVAKISPASTPDDPTRVQVTTETETKTPATTDPVTGEPIPEKTEKKPTENEDLCTLHPEALACWEKGDPEEVDLETGEKNVTLAPDSGWGASGASCPADLTHTLRQGTQLKLSWQPLCQMANTFRPLVIGLAWLSSILIFLGISRRAT